jgi:hypothetical protein
MNVDTISYKRSKIRYLNLYLKKSLIRPFYFWKTESLGCTKLRKIAKMTDDTCTQSEDHTPVIKRTPKTFASFTGPKIPFENELSVPLSIKNLKKASEIKEKFFDYIKSSLQVKAKSFDCKKKLARPKVVNFLKKNVEKINSNENKDVKIPTHRRSNTDPLADCAVVSSKY